MFLHSMEVALDDDSSYSVYSTEEPTEEPESWEQVQAAAPTKEPAESVTNISHFSETVNPEDTPVFALIITAIAAIRKK